MFGWHPHFSMFVLIWSAIGMCVCASKEKGGMGLLWTIIFFSQLYLAPAWFWGR